MLRDSKVYLDDVLQAIHRIVEYTKGMSAESFAHDAKSLDAVVRNLEVIGEAVKRLPPAWKARHNQVEWKKIAATRDILIHEYFGVDAAILWDIIITKLPVLEAAIKNLLESV